MKNLIFLIPLISSPAFAGGPVISSSCEVAQEIRTPAESNGYYLSDDCKTAYVLPPSIGSVEVVGATVNAMNRCSEVRGLKKSLDAINKKIQTSLKGSPNEVEIKKQLELKKTLLDGYAELNTTLAASVEINFGMDIAQNLENFRLYNEGLGVTFVTANVKDLKLEWNQKQNQDTSMPVAFNQSVPVSNLKEIGVGSFSVRLDLTPYGACALQDPYTKTLPRRMRAKDLAGIITTGVSYTYELAAKYKYTATFNRGALAKKIRQSSTSGGFFKTSSASSLIETAESTGWFSLEMSCDDSRVCDQAKIQTAKELKQNLMQEVLDGIALANFGVSLPPVDSATPPENGATKAANGLRKCPHPYCQAGAVILDIASAVTGGSSKTDSYITKNDHTATDNVSIETPVAFYGMISFINDRK